jgi:hypothetical protein
LEEADRDPNVVQLKRDDANLNQKCHHVPTQIQPLREVEETDDTRHKNGRLLIEDNIEKPIEQAQCACLFPKDVTNERIRIEKENSDEITESVESREVRKNKEE